MERTSHWRAALLCAALLGGGLARASVTVPQTRLPGSLFQKWVDQVPTFVGARVDDPNVRVGMEEFQQQILPASEYLGLQAPFNQGTYVWSYKVGDRPVNYPGYTIEARRWRPTTVTYVNELQGANGAPPFLQKYLSIDQMVHWADPFGLQCNFNPTQPQCFQPYAGPVPTTVHLHGGEIPSAFDGGPDQWFTPDGLYHGTGYASLFPVAGNAAVYRYPNGQEATTLFFHDHALGTTRINVFSGLVAFYFIRDDLDTGEPDNPLRLPAGGQEIELAIQDRMFDTNRQLLFPDDGDNPAFHPLWKPEFFGDVIVVNGKSWPYLEVEPRRYRLRMVDGSNARFYNLALVDQNGAAGPPMWQIGTDGGLLDRPVAIGSPSRLLMGPGERADLIVDFSKVPSGTVLTLTNDAVAPFPSGDPADPNTTAQIMQFRVVKALSSKDRSCDPTSLGKDRCELRRRTPIVRLADPATGSISSDVNVSVKRQLVLKEIEGQNGPQEVLLNNTRWMGIKESTLTTTMVPVADSTKLLTNYLNELPQVGATEEWEIINLTPDAHPIHVHLVQYQVLTRQAFDPAYLNAWTAAFPGGVASPGDGPPLPYLTPNGDGAVGGNPAIGPYLDPAGPMPVEPRLAGWKDTAVALPGQVTRLMVRFAPQDWPVKWVQPGQNLYPFDPTLVIGRTCNAVDRHSSTQAFDDRHESKDERSQGSSIVSLTGEWEYEREMEHSEARGSGDPCLDFAGNPPGPGYVWHCHIIDHEDNEMMRPFSLRK